MNILIFVSDFGLVEIILFFPQFMFCYIECYFVTMWETFSQCKLVQISVIYTLLSLLNFSKTIKFLYSALLKKYVK